MSVNETDLEYVNLSFEDSIALDCYLNTVGAILRNESHLTDEEFQAAIKSLVKVSYYVAGAFIDTRQELIDESIINKNNDSCETIS